MGSSPLLGLSYMLAAHFNQRLLLLDRKDNNVRYRCCVWLHLTLLESGRGKHGWLSFKAVPPIGDKCHVILLSAYSATCQVPNRIASDLHTLLRNNLSITKYGQGLGLTQQLHHVAHCKNPKSILTFHSQLELLLNTQYTILGFLSEKTTISPWCSSDVCW